MSKLNPPIGPTDHVAGKATAPAVLTEYGDYECPYCGEAYLVLQSILGELGDAVRFVFRNFPLAEMHPHALVAAQAAEAAGAQGLYWPMHDVLYENQIALEPEHLVEYAASLELDVPRFVDELREGVHLAKVKSDFRSGVRSGVNGTPTFFVGDERWDESWDHDTLKTGLVRAIRAARTERGSDLRR